MRRVREALQPGAAGVYVDPVSIAMDREYRYRRLIPMSHEQYLDEPWDVIEWTLRLHDMREARRQRRGDSGAA